MNLPKINIKFIGILISAFLLFFILLPVKVSFAQPATGSGGLGADDTSQTTGWVRDPEVTFVGKTASRSAQFLDWTIQNYNWICMVRISDNQCDNTGNPLVKFWETIRNIVYGVIALFVLATAFVLIITRGQNITIM